MHAPTESTICRIAGNLLAGREPNPVPLAPDDVLAVRWAVAMARAIVAEAQRTTTDEARGPQ
jgi:hypothetical protein